MAQGVVEAARRRSSGCGGGWLEQGIGPVGVALVAFGCIPHIGEYVVGLVHGQSNPRPVGMRSFGMAGLAGWRGANRVVIGGPVALGAIGEATCTGGGELGTQPTVLGCDLPTGLMAGTVRMALETTDPGNAARGSFIRRRAVAGGTLGGIRNELCPVVLQPVGGMLTRCGIELGRVAVGAASAAPQ